MSHGKKVVMIVNLLKVNTLVQYIIVQSMVMKQLNGHIVKVVEEASVCIQMEKKNAKNVEKNLYFVLRTFVAMIHQKTKNNIVIKKLKIY